MYLQQDFHDYAEGRLKDFTGQYHEAGIGLYYYNARWYDSRLARFTQADTIVPDPASPMSLNRYMYVMGNPLRYREPTGHYIFAEDPDVPYRLPKPTRPKPPPNYNKPADSNSTSCAACHGPSSSGNPLGAYNKWNTVRNALGRSTTYGELLALLAHLEFGGLKDANYDLALEALGRQFYDDCKGGICRGTQLWDFLGGLGGWTAKKNSAVKIAGIILGPLHATRHMESAMTILSQPSYSDSDPYPVKARTWQSGWEEHVPFTFGNYSLFWGGDDAPEAQKIAIYEAMRYVSTGSAREQMLVNLSTVNPLGPIYNNGFVVMNEFQKDFWYGEAAKIKGQGAQ